MSNTVTISLKRYLKLLYSSAVLQALEAGGVDNWNGIDWAMSSLARLEDLEDEDNLTLEMIEDALKG